MTAPGTPAPGPNAAGDERVDAESIVRLRGEAPRVVRLSRKAIGLASAAGLALVGGALIFALRSPNADAGEELANTGGVAVAEGLASAPADYSEVPRLGPPLPGDLGKSILDAQDRGAVAALPPASGAATVTQVPPPDPAEMARQRLEQEREAARASRLFAAGSAGVPVPAAVPVPPSASLLQTSQPNPATGSTGFLERPVDRRTASGERLTGTGSNATLMAGAIIPAALITGVRSDQPGLVTAQVTQNVFDSLTGRRLLIPQGSRLVGDYASDVGFGQRRVLLAWNRLILPDGRSIVLERQPASDPSGYAGLEDGVDYHWGGVLRAALVSTLLAIGAESGSGSDEELARALRRGSQDSVNRAGEQVVSRELGVRPTLTIRPGTPVRVLVTRDLVLGPAS
ncbi:TrbI/VirB10 family protein [Porphyrobacter sp. YT40]|nr:TrbI/VirB10 family protein [Porphyrobacter sp. YT40]